MKPLPEIDFSQLRTSSLYDQPSKVKVEDFGIPTHTSVDNLVELLPRLLAGDSLRQWRDAICAARSKDNQVAVAMGAHVIKAGCSRYIIDWIKSGMVTAIAMNGAAAIHDVEIAIAGHTSENVEERLATGDFGMSREAANIISYAANRDGATGLGKSIGWYLEDLVKSGIRDSGLHSSNTTSVILAAYNFHIPCTIHTALGTDTINMHPQVNGSALGESSMRDFRKICSVIAAMKDGVWMNLGSAVIMPEVFLKGVAVARNLGHDLSGITTVDLDMIQSYRARLNMQRVGGKSLSITGHHEIIIPLIFAAVASKMRRPGI